MILSVYAKTKPSDSCADCTTKGDLHYCEQCDRLLCSDCFFGHDDYEGCAICYNCKDDSDTLKEGEE